MSDAELEGVHGASEAVAPAPHPLFRAQAMAAHRRASTLGSPLRLMSAWTVWSVRVVVLLVVAAVVFAAFVRVADTTQAPAVIRVDGRHAVTARAAGTVADIPVRPGTRVEVDTVLVRLDDTLERAELARVEREYELSLARLLRDPRDSAQRQHLATLGAEAALARTRLDERTVRASLAGVVSDVRAHVGEVVEPGSALLAIDGPEARIVAIALVPGHERPRVSADTPLHLRLDGFSREPIAVTVQSIADEVVGPAEALRYLGEDRAGTIELHGPVVVMEAALPGRDFESNGERFRFYDGMQGVLEIEVDSRSILDSVLPGRRR